MVECILSVCVRASVSVCLCYICVAYYIVCHNCGIFSSSSPYQKRLIYYVNPRKRITETRSCCFKRVYILVVVFFSRECLFLPNYSFVFSFFSYMGIFRYYCCCCCCWCFFPACTFCSVQFLTVYRLHLINGSFFSLFFCSPPHNTSNCSKFKF